MIETEMFLRRTSKRRLKNSFYFLPQLSSGRNNHLFQSKLSRDRFLFNH